MSFGTILATMVEQRVSLAVAFSEGGLTPSRELRPSRA